MLGNILESLGRPPLILLDIRPLNYPMVIVADHEIAEQVSRASKGFPYSLPKSPTMTYIDPLVGHHSLVSIQVFPRLPVPLAYWMLGPGLTYLGRALALPPQALQPRLRAKPPPHPPSRNRRESPPFPRPPRPPRLHGRGHAAGRLHHQPHVRHHRHGDHGQGLCRPAAEGSALGTY